LSFIDAVGLFLGSDEQLGTTMGEAMQSDRQTRKETLYGEVKPKERGYFPTERLPGLSFGLCHALLFP